MINFKPCPKCGSIPHLIAIPIKPDSEYAPYDYKYMVKCYKWGCSKMKTVGSKTPKRAIERWNKGYIGGYYE